MHSRPNRDLRVPLVVLGSKRMMRGRNKHDVFVIGEEDLAETATLPTMDGVAPEDAQEPEGLPLPCLEHRGPGGPRARRSRRRLGAVGLAAVPAAALALLEISSSGRAAPEQRPQASAPLAPVLRPAPRAAVPPAPAAPPSSRHRDHGPGGERQAAPAERRGEPEREPIPTEAPVSSPPPLPAPPSDPAPAPPPPSLSPPSGGGGSGGVEQFGFER
jgi:hypothetical protein